MAVSNPFHSQTAVHATCVCFYDNTALDPHHGAAASACGECILVDSVELYARGHVLAERCLHHDVAIACTCGGRKRAFVESALRELSVALCRGNSRIVRAYTAVVARVAGKALLPGLPVASADAADTDSL
jgi:hypothetical protein